MRRLWEGEGGSNARFGGVGFTVAGGPLLLLLLLLLLTAVAARGRAGWRSDAGTREGSVVLPLQLLQSFPCIPDGVTLLTGGVELTEAVVGVASLLVLSTGAFFSEVCGLRVLNAGRVLATTSTTSPMASARLTVCRDGGRGARDAADRESDKDISGLGSATTGLGTAPDFSAEKDFASLLGVLRLVGLELLRPSKVKRRPLALMADVLMGTGSKIECFFSSRGGALWREACPAALASVVLALAGTGWKPLRVGADLRLAGCRACAAVTVFARVDDDVSEVCGGRLKGAAGGCATTPKSNGVPHVSLSSSSLLNSPMKLRS